MSFVLCSSHSIWLRRKGQIKSPPRWRGGDPCQENLVEVRRGRIDGVDDLPTADIHPAQSQKGYSQRRSFTATAHPSNLEGILVCPVRQDGPMKSHLGASPIASSGSPTHWNRQSSADFYQPRYPFDVEGSVSLRTGGVTTASRSSPRPFLNQLVNRLSKAFKVAEKPLTHLLPSSYLAARCSLKPVTQLTSFLLTPNC